METRDLILIFLAVLFNPILIMLYCINLVLFIDWIVDKYFN